MTRQRGMALLLVLGVLAVLATSLGVIAGTVRLHQFQARYQMQQTQAGLAAEAGITLAVMGLQALGPGNPWKSNGEVHHLEFDDSRLSVSVRSERGKLDLNSASADDIKGVLIACGYGGQQAQQVAQSLTRKREDAPLRTLEEFREFSRLSYSLFECVSPLITVWSGETRPDASLANPVLLRALGIRPMDAAPGNEGRVFTITSEATLRGGGHTSLQVTLMLTTETVGAKPYRVLRWKE